MIRHDSRSRNGPRALGFFMLATAWGLLAGCAAPQGKVPAGPVEIPMAAESPPEAADPTRHAHQRSDRLRLLEQVAAQLRQEIADTEHGLANLERTLSLGLNRADAVTFVAEAELSVRRAGESLGTSTALAESRTKLDLAALHLEKGNYGAAVFFAHRAVSHAQVAQTRLQRVAEASNVLYVKVGQANLRREPSLEGRIIAVLPRDTPLFMSEQSGNWVLGRTANGKAGWISLRLLESR